MKKEKEREKERDNQRWRVREEKREREREKDLEEEEEEEESDLSKILKSGIQILSRDVCGCFIYLFLLVPTIGRSDASP